MSWSSAFSTDTSNITFQWPWSAAACSAFSARYAASSPVTSNVLGVNAEDGSADANGTDPAGTPETYKADEIVGFFSPAAGVTPAAAEMIRKALGNSKLPGSDSLASVGLMGYGRMALAADPGDLDAFQPPQSALGANATVLELPKQGRRP